MSLNGTVDNPDNSKVMTGIKIPLLITFPNKGPPAFDYEIPELKLK